MRSTGNRAASVRWLLAFGWLLALPLGAPAQTSADRVRQRVTQALALERAGDFAAAELLLREVLTDQPAEVSALLALERVARRRDALAAVLPWVERAVRASPGQEILRHVQLRVLGDLRWESELRRAGADWIALAPREAAPYREYAAALERLGSRDSALAVLLRGRQALGGPPALGVELADAYLALARWEPAALQWLRLLRDGAHFRRLVLEKVAVHWERARPAIAVLVDSLARPGAAPEDGAVAAVAAVYLGEDSIARRLASRALPELSASARRDLAEELARAASRLGRPEITAWSYALLLEGTASPLEWGQAALRVARFDLQRGDTASASRLLSDALERTPPGSGVHRSASALLLELAAGQGRGAEAQTLLSRHAARYPGDRELARLASAVAAAHLRAEEIDAATLVLDRFVPASVTDPAAAAAVDAVRARIALYEGDWERARERFQFAAAALQGAERTEAIELAALVESSTDRERRALAHALRHLEAGRAEEAAAAVADLAADGSRARSGLLLWTARLSGLPSVAAALLRTLLRDHPAAPEAPAALLRLAEIAAAEPAQGGPGEARALLERLILEHPESALVPLARRRLNELETRVPSS